ncbi:MAG TPA: hypothetical protein VNR65_01455, partial [Geobacterales bacterium]|nr:hypothetical protein [Geobacterales bacterium]
LDASAAPRQALPIALLQAPDHNMAAASAMIQEPGTVWRKMIEAKQVQAPDKAPQRNCGGDGIAPL